MQPNRMATDRNNPGFSEEIQRSTGEALADVDPPFTRELCNVCTAGNSDSRGY